MLSSLFLVGFAALCLPALADVDCNLAFYETQFDVPRADLRADCHKLLAHIPSVARIPNDLVYPRELSTSSPFLPQASYTHKTCVIGATFYRKGRSPTANSAWNATFEPMSNMWLHEKTPLAPLLEATVFEILENVKEAALQVTDQCIAHGHSGVAWGSLDFPETRSVWRSVDVRTVGASEPWGRLARMDTKMAMRGGLAPGYSSVNNPFQETFNDV